MWVCVQEPHHKETFIIHVFPHEMLKKRARLDFLADHTIMKNYIREFPSGAAAVWL